jgi:hypothetical protein
MFKLSTFFEAECVLFVAAPMNDSNEDLISIVTCTKIAWKYNWRLGETERQRMMIDELREITGRKS